MRIEILKPIATMYGGFRAGQVIDIPEVVAKKWCKIGLARESRKEVSFVVEPGSQVGTEISGVETKEPKVKPETIPDGMLWCEKHRTLHRLSSPTGTECQERIAKEAAERVRIEQEKAEMAEEPEKLEETVEEEPVKLEETVEEKAEETS